MCLNPYVSKSFIYVLLAADNIEWFKEIIKEGINHTDVIDYDLKYRHDTVGSKNENLISMAEGLRNLAEIIYLAPDGTFIELSAFPNSDPICLATCIGKHCQLGLRNLHKIYPEVDDPTNDHDVKIVIRLVEACEYMNIAVCVTQWQYFDEMAFPVRIQIRVGDLRRVVGVEG